MCAGVNGVGELARAVTRKMQCSGRSAEQDLIMEEATSGNCPAPIFALSFKLVFAGAGGAIGPAAAAARRLPSAKFCR